MREMEDEREKNREKKKHKDEEVHDDFFIITYSKEAFKFHDYHVVIENEVAILRFITLYVLWHCKLFV